MRPYIFVMSLFFVSSLSSAALAADCNQLKILNQVPMHYGMAGRQIIVPVTLNGSEASFLVDTGGLTTSVSRRLAEQLSLPTQRGSRAIYGATGAVSRDFVSVHSFSIGRLHGAYTEFPIAPGLNQDGILSLNYMRGYDIDFDFSTNVMSFFSQDHCPGAVIYWKSAATGTVPITMHNGHMTVPVTLDGKAFTAIIDTGSTASTLRMDIAQSSYGLIPGSPDTPEQGFVNGNRTLKTYHHVFGSLAVGDIVVRNADLSIIPSAMDRSDDVTQSHRPKALFRDHYPEITVGMDVLRKLHVYMALGEQKLYVSTAELPTGTSPEPLATTHSPTP